jgi:hypothetical protein
MKTVFKSTLLAILLFLGLLNTGFGQSHVWYLYRSDGAQSPACSSSPSSLAIPFTENFAAGIVIKANNGLCYTIAYDGYQMSDPTIDYIEEYSTCTECSDGGYVDPCTNVVANWVDLGQFRCNGNASEKFQIDLNSNCTKNAPRWVVADANGCNPYGSVAFWQDNGQNRCNGNASEMQQVDLNAGYTGNAPRWVVVDPNGCNPCNGVVANWQDNGATRCNGNASEKQQSDQNAGCTGNAPRWIVVDPNGCNPCNGVVASWVFTGNQRCNGNAKEWLYRDQNTNCTGNQDKWVVVDPNGCNPCNGVVANWQDNGVTRCNGNASEKQQADQNAGCTGNVPRWVVADANGCNPYGSVAFWQDNGQTRCNGNASEKQQIDLNAGFTGNTPRWVVVDPNGCNPCNGVVANWQDNGQTRCIGNAREKQQSDQNAGCTGNTPRWVVADANGCNPYGSVAFWQDNGQTRCNGNASEKQQVDLNTGFTGNAPRWVVADANGCNPCNGVVANWQDNGVTRCNGNASEKQQADQNVGCTGNTPRWVVVDPNGCNPCNGVVANWQDNGVTRCNGNASEKQQSDQNASCTGNVPRWVLVDPNGCAPYHVWNLYRSQGADNPACSSSPSSLTIPYTSNFAPGIIIKASNGYCYTIGVDGYQTSAPTIDFLEEFSVCSECKEGLAPVDPCLGVVANWQDNGVTRCNGDAREKQQIDQNAGCTKNEPRWIVVDPMGCHNPCLNVVADWHDNGITRCNGNASEKQQDDWNFLCTKNSEPRWVVVDPNGCAPYHVWNLYRSQGADNPACSSSPSSLTIPYTSNFTPGIVIKANNGYCYTIGVDGYQTSAPTIDFLEEFSVCSECKEGLAPVDPCLGVVANWQDNGVTRCNGDAREKQQIDQNAGCTKNEPRWIVVDPMGCHNPCLNVVADWHDNGITRCNGNASEKQQDDWNFLCTKNSEPRWVVVDPNGCAPYHVWNLYRSQGADNPACSSSPSSLTIPYTSNFTPGIVIKASNGYCYTIGVEGYQTSAPTIDFLEEFSVCSECKEGLAPVDPCLGVVANWQDNGVTRCNGDAREKQQIDQNAGCTKNEPRWVVVDPMGCHNPCDGVVANWQDNGVTRCNGNASEKQQNDLNFQCTLNTEPRWVVVDPNGCAPYHVWNLYRSQGADNPACSSSPSSLTIPYTSNFTPGIVIKASNGYCYTIGVEGYQTSAPTIDFLEEFSVCSECKEGLAPVDPCLGVVANWQDNGVTRCNGDAREKQQIDQNAGCTKNEPRWVVVDPMGCHNPCDGVVANWQDNGVTRCNGNASEKQQNDLNFYCTLNTEPRWVVVDPNGCNPYGAEAFWQDNGQTRCNGNASEKQQTDLNAGFTGNTSRWVVVDSNGCNPYGAEAFWQDNGQTRCNGNASEKQQTDLNAGFTGNTSRWVVVDPNGCNPCNGVVANWQDNGVTRCNGNASEKQQADLNASCTKNTTRWVVVDSNGCNPYGAEAFWQDNGQTRCNGNASEKQQTDLNAGFTGNAPRWVVVDPNGCNPCNGVVAIWTRTGEKRCTSLGTEEEEIDKNALCTGNAPRWILTIPLPLPGKLIAGAKTVCKGGSTIISINDQKGAIQWQEKIGGYWYNLTQQHNPDLNTAALYESKTYRAVVSSGVCPRIESEEITIAVNVISKPILTTNSSSIDYGGTATLSAAEVKGEKITWSDFQVGNQISVSPFSTSKYSAYATNALGCKSDTSAIVISVLPAAPVITGKYKILDGSFIENTDIKVCKGELVQLETIKGCSTGSIEWSIVDSSIIHKTDVVAIEPVKYIARCKSSEGYSKASNTVSVTPKSLDLNVDDIVVYPNPTSGLLRLKSSSCLEGLWVQIYTVTGAVLYHNYNSNRIGDELVYDFTELPWEQYFIHLSNDKDQHVWIRVWRGL